MCSNHSLFHRRWIKLIMECVSFVRYTVRFNSMETDVICPTCGLRQGDPLSSCLFLIVAKGLSSMIRGAEGEKSLQWARVCREALMVTQLLYADNSLLLMRAHRENAICLKSILDRYCSNSGQKVSEAKSSFYHVKKKSSFYFSGNTGRHKSRDLWNP